MAVMDDIVKKVFDTGLWNVSGQLDLVNQDSFGSLISAGIFVAFGAAVIQMFLSIVNVYKDQNKNIMDLIAPLIIKMVIVGAIVNPVVYPAIVKYVFAYPADSIASMVTETYFTHLMNSYSTVLDAIANSPNKITSVITATMNGSLVSTFISGLIFWAVVICVVVTPLIQGMLFLFVYYVGPICIAFTLCDYTESVTKAWIGLMLTVCWMGFFGSCSFLVIDSLDLLSKVGVAAGGDTPNVILTLVYGVVSIILFCSCFPITAYFFNSISSISALTNPGASAGVGAMVLGAAGKATGAGISKVSKEGSILNTLGKSLERIGEVTSKAGRGVAESSGARIPHLSKSSNTGMGNSGRGSPNIPKNLNPEQIQKIKDGIATIKSSGSYDEKTLSILERDVERSEQTLAADKIKEQILNGSIEKNNKGSTGTNLTFEADKPGGVAMMDKPINKEKNVFENDNSNSKKG